jgi:hypothetical protein
MTHFILTEEEDVRTDLKANSKTMRNQENMQETRRIGHMVKKIKVIN